MKLALRLGGFAVAIAIMALLISRLGWDAIAAQLALTGPGFIWILVLHAFALAIVGVPWFLLLPREIRPTFGGAIASRFIASGAAAVMPVVGFAGDLVRLLWLRKGERAPGVAAIVVDRLMYTLSSVAVLAAGLVGLLHVPSLPADYTRAATIGAVGLIAIVVVAIVVTTHGDVASRIDRLVHRFRKNVDTDKHFGADVDRHLKLLFRVRSRGPWIAFGLHVFARFVMGAEIYIGFALLDVQLGWDEALVFAALPVILSVLGAVIPSQLGVHEGAQALVAASFGIDPATAVAVVLLLRLRQLAGAAVVGVLLLARRGKLTPVPA